MISILFLVAILVTLTIVALPQIEFMSSNPQRFAEMATKVIRSYGVWGVLIYMLLQVFHVVIAAIPGEIAQMIGGYIYGTLLGALYTEIGIVVGIIIVFQTVRLLGYPAVKTFLPVEKLKKFDFLMNNQRSEVVLFILFLIPGIPKDAITYLAGLTPIKPFRFIVINAVARFPGILGSAYMGAKLGAGDYGPVIVVGIVATVLFLLGVIFQKRIVDAIHRMRRETPPAN